jgi:hypothetical protein
MALVRPRLTDYYSIPLAQAQVDFAIPFFEEDIPLYIDPFLLWRSPSQQDNALHTTIQNSFNRLNWLIGKGREDEAARTLVLASECEEVGLGVSATKRGKRIGEDSARSILSLFKRIPEYSKFGFTHFEEIQLYIDGISKDRISDISGSFIKSFLIDYTIENSEKLGIPLADSTIPLLYDYRSHSFKENVAVKLPVGPDSARPIILVPKRWLRYNPWINFEDYFATACPKDDVVNKQGADERVQVLLYNRENYGAVSEYVKAKERTAQDCQNDPLFKQIPVLSARRKLVELQKIEAGKSDGADKRYEEIVGQLLSSVLYPQLDFADSQSRTDGGSLIRDLIFYNTGSVDLLKQLIEKYESRQIVMEIKNVQSISGDHINQLNRYLNNEFGAFGVLVTRKPLSNAMLRNTIQLWAGQRRCILALTDDDLRLMVDVYESKQRLPIDVLNKKYVEFIRACPS